MHKRFVHKMILILGLITCSTFAEANTLYKVTGHFGDVISHTTIDGNVPILGDFPFYVGTGPIDGYVAPGSISGDFNTGFVSLGYANGLLDLDYTNPTDNGLQLTNSSQRSEWDPSNSTLTLQRTQTNPTVLFTLTLPFGPGFTGNGPVMISGDPLDTPLYMLWQGLLNGQPSQIQAWYSLDWATMTEVTNDPGTAVPELGTAFALGTGLLLLVTAKCRKRWFIRFPGIA